MCFSFGPLGCAPRASECLNGILVASTTAVHSTVNCRRGVKSLFLPLSTLTTRRSAEISALSRYRDCRTVESSTLPIEVRCVKDDGLACQRKLESWNTEEFSWPHQSWDDYSRSQSAKLLQKSCACVIIQLEMNLFLSLNKSIQGHERTILTRGVSVVHQEFSSNTQTLLFLYSYLNHILGYSHRIIFCDFQVSVVLYQKTKLAKAHKPKHQ